MECRVSRLSVWVMAAMVCSLATSTPLPAQEVPAVAVKDLRKAPQKFWASNFVFEDVLEKPPGKKTVEIDDVEYTRFEARGLGDIYAEEGLLDRLRALETGTNYLFVGTVSQKSWSFLGLFGGSKYLVIVSDVTAPRQNIINITGRLPSLDLEFSTNRINQTFARLDEIFKEVQTDMLGFASSEQLSLENVFSGNEHRDKVAASVRSALRRYEEKNRGTSQELFIDTIISMMAIQYGYGEEKKESYQPAELAPAEGVILVEKSAANPAAPDANTEAAAGTNTNSSEVVEAYPEIESAEDWDISRVIDDIVGTNTTEAVAPVEESSAELTNAAPVMVEEPAASGFAETPAEEAPLEVVPPEEPANPVAEDSGTAETLEAAPGDPNNAD